MVKYQQRMQELKIDQGLHDLIATMWDHNYETFYSCDGHGIMEKYIVFKGGDGWFEKNSKELGLYKRRKRICCIFNDGDICCTNCGAGKNGYVVYRSK